MRTVILVCLLSVGVLAAEESASPLESAVGRVEALTLRARARLEELATFNRQALERLAAEGDLTQRLWAERELRVLHSAPFANLDRPKGLVGYPEALENHSRALRAELVEFSGQLKAGKTTILEETERIFDMRERAWVRTGEIERAKKGRVEVESFRVHRSHDEMDKEIQNLDRLLEGKGRGHLWRRPKEDPFPAPPDALYLFEPDNSAFRSFVDRVRVISRGSPGRGGSGVLVGGHPALAGKRGLSLIALMGDEVVLRARYDTYESKSEGLRLVEDVKGLPYGAFVVLFSHDDATRRFPGEAQSTLFRLGASKGIQELAYRGAYVLIGVKGMSPGGAIEMLHYEKIRFPAQ